MPTQRTTTDDPSNSTKPMRAIVTVVYVHADVGDEKVREAQTIMIDSLLEDGPDWVDDGVQMLASQILPLMPHEGVEYYIDDLDDLDDDEVWDLDDFRDAHKHGSTPR